MAVAVAVAVAVVLSTPAPLLGAKLTKHISKPHFMLLHVVRTSYFEKGGTML